MPDDEFICPVCGATVPAKARACPECGSDEQTGWSDQAGESELDLPDSEFNYQDFVDREFGTAKPVPRGMTTFWWIVALLVLGTFLLFWLRN